ncbi:MAG: TetR/AcrR family transcriptional regulator [Microthrixaceae bacterium]
MSTAYEQNGRTAQKRRTREALVAAAREMVAEGMTPTVEAAAAGALISRTTAYRYFPSQRALLAAAHPETAAESLLPENPPSDAGARLDLVVDAFTRMIVDTEAQQRTMLRLSLEADPAERSELPLRQGRAIGWIEEALAPLEPDLTGPQRHRLAIAIRATTGIEALAWLTDVAGLSRDDAVGLMRWSARGLLGAAVADPTAIDPQRSTRTRQRG